MIARAIASRRFVGAVAVATLAVIACGSSEPTVDRTPGLAPSSTCFELRVIGGDRTLRELAEHAGPSARPFVVGSVRDLIDGAIALPGPVRDGTACTVCGLTLREFRASGRLGCPACYGAFDQPLRDLLKRVHGDHTHAGRRYEPPLPEGAQRQNSLLELRAALKRAIDAEQFEQAASLRDQIRGLE